MYFTVSRTGQQAQERKQTISMLETLPGSLELLEDAADGDEDVVYVLQALTGGPIKIGHTTWSAREQRRRQIQIGSPTTLVFRRIVRGGMWLEQALHAYFAYARLSGEWFSLVDDMIHLCPEAFDGR